MIDGDIGQVFGKAVQFIGMTLYWALFLIACLLILYGPTILVNVFVR